MEALIQLGIRVWFGGALPELSALLRERGLDASAFKIDPRRLGLATQLVIAEQTIDVAADGFGQDPRNEAFREDVRNHVLGSPELYLVYTDRVCVAFAALENLEVGEIPVLYLAGLMVKKEYQGNSLMTRLVSYEIGNSRPDVIVARTQNPCVLDLMRNFCERDALFPYAGSPQGKCRQVSRLLAYEFLEMENFDPESLISVATYGGCLYGNGVPRSRHQESNAFFERINVNRGDSILLLGEVDHGR